MGDPTIVGEKLATQFRAEIEAWDWVAIKKEAESELHKNCEGDLEGWCFLGTVFSLTPSGKYYLPFACSNVTLCPRCHGAGFLVLKKRLVKKLQAKVKRRRELMQKRGLIGPRCPEREFRRWKALNRLLEKYQPTCPVCEGVGSREAYEDEVWREVIEEVAEGYDLSICAGEGDPCDIFAVHTEEPPDEDDAYEDQVWRDGLIVDGEYAPWYNGGRRSGRSTNDPQT